MLVAFSVTPIGTGEAVGEAVAEAVRIVRESGLPNRTDAMFTTIEGDWVGVLLTIFAGRSIATQGWPRSSRNAAFAAMALFGRRLGFGADLVGDGE